MKWVNIANTCTEVKKFFVYHNSSEYHHKCNNLFERDALINAFGIEGDAPCSKGEG